MPTLPFAFYKQRDVDKGGPPQRNVVQWSFEGFYELNAFKNPGLDSGPPRDTWSSTIA